MDELAEKLKMDPVQLRLVNYAERDMSEDKPWSSKHLRECYAEASKRFGWEKRRATPGQMVEGNKLIGYGMATATYPANRSAADGGGAAELRMGRAFAGSGTQDLGTGTYTIMAQTAAAGLGIEPRKVTVKLGGFDAAEGAGFGRIAECGFCVSGGGGRGEAGGAEGGADGGERWGVSVAWLGCGDGDDEGVGRVFVEKEPAKGEDVGELMRRNGGKPVEAMGSAEPGEDKTAGDGAEFRGGVCGGGGG